MAEAEAQGPVEPSLVVGRASDLQRWAEPCSCA